MTLILQKAAAIRDPLECSFFLTVPLPYQQPFMDGNKRMSRLAANIPLIQANMSPLSFTGVEVPDYTTAILAVYELSRVELLREVVVKRLGKLDAAEHARRWAGKTSPPVIGRTSSS